MNYSAKSSVIPAFLELNTLSSVLSNLNNKRLANIQIFQAKPTGGGGSRSLESRLHWLKNKSLANTLEIDTLGRLSCVCPCVAGHRVTCEEASYGGTNHALSGSECSCCHRICLKPKLAACDKGPGSFPCKWIRCCLINIQLRNSILNTSVVCTLSRAGRPGLPALLASLSLLSADKFC